MNLIKDLEVIGLVVKFREPWVKATCPNGHRVTLNPMDGVYGFWLCPKCGVRHYQSQWKYLYWGPRMRLIRKPKEIPREYKPHKHIVNKPVS